MIGRHIRLGGVRLIEEALFKEADIFNPTLSGLKASKTRELGASVPQTATATVPKILTPPTT